MNRNNLKKDKSGKQNQTPQNNSGKDTIEEPQF